jgi:A/G-specific adenine glycosylase
MGPPELTPAERGRVVTRLLSWYGRNARDLPWRRAGATPWQVMVSEFMLQQTPVNRVREPWEAWISRWSSPTALAAAPAGEAVRAWGRLGYPRRALRLHQAARMITAEHGGRVPDRKEDLLRLPGVGSYTAAAVLAFGYGQRHVVLDTNVRRVLARVAGGAASPTASTTAAEVVRAERFVPRTAARAARWAVASMEFGAMVCTARSPRCAACPVAAVCRWRLAGFPGRLERRRPAQQYHGTDRQCRGALLAVLRSTDAGVPLAELDASWIDAPQRERALASLVADGLVVRLADDSYALPP